MVGKLAKDIIDTTDADALTAEVIRRLCERFGESLVSVVLYGSHARGEAQSRSDIVLLVVISSLPKEWRVIHALEDEVMFIGHGFNRRLDIRLVEPGAVSHAVDEATPLLLEIYDAHCVLYDPHLFFAREMNRFTEVIRDRGIRRFRRGVWRVPSVA